MSSDKNITQTIRDQINQLVGEYAAHTLGRGEFIPGQTAIPPSGKMIDALELQLMVEASLDGWLTAGRFNTTFENRLSDFLGVKHVLTVNSGSSANLIAFNALTSPQLGTRSIMPGDEVITVAAGFPTTVNPLIQFGAIPVFIDVDIGTYNILSEEVEAAITDKTKAIMLAHTLGNPFNLDVIQRLCKKYGLWLVEDCCDALGSLYNDQKVGTFGDIGTLSFYPAHHITMGEGGAVFTNNSELCKIAESIRDWGRDCYCAPGADNTCNKRYCWKLGNLPEGYDHKYIYSHLGYNLKLTDMQAACGVAQLDKLETFIKKRKENFNYLYQSLQQCVNQLILPVPTKSASPSWFGFPLTLREGAGIHRRDFLEYLNQNNIGTRLLFAGNLTRQPYMIGRKFKVHGSLRNTDTIMNNTFWVGLQPALSEDALNFVCKHIKRYLGFDFD